MGDAKGAARRRAVLAELAPESGSLPPLIEADLSATQPSGSYDAPGASRALDLLAWFARRLLERWVDDTGLTDEDVARVRSEGARLARERADLSEVMQAWRRTPRIVADQVQQWGVDRLDATDFVDLSDVILETSTLLGETLDIAYHAEAARLDRGVEDARAHLLSEIMAGEQSTHSTFEERIAALELDLPSDPVVVAVVVTREPFAPPSHRELDDLARECGEEAGRGPSPGEGAPPRILVVAPDELTAGHPAATGALLLPAPTLQELSRQIAQRHWRAAARRVPTWSECSRALRSTRTALQLAPRWAFADRAVLTDTDVQALEMLHNPMGIPTAAFASAVLGDLLAEDNADLLAAVQAHLGSGSVPTAARTLGIHPHTLRRRLVQAGELTGRDVQSGWDRFVLGLATTVASEGSATHQTFDFLD